MFCSYSIRSNTGENYQYTASVTDVVDVNFVSPSAESSNTIFQYTGRHDHGKTPILRNTGDVAVLLTSLMHAKADCDRHLTACINEKYGYDNDSNAINEQVESCDGVENQAKKLKKGE